MKEEETVKQPTNLRRARINNASDAILKEKLNSFAFMLRYTNGEEIISELFSSEEEAAEEANFSVENAMKIKNRSYFEELKEIVFLEVNGIIIDKNDKEYLDTVESNSITMGNLKEEVFKEW